MHSKPECVTYGLAVFFFNNDNNLTLIHYLHLCLTFASFLLLIYDVLCLIRWRRMDILHRIMCIRAKWCLCDMIQYNGIKKTRHFHIYTHFHFHYFHTYFSFLCLAYFFPVYSSMEITENSHLHEIVSDVCMCHISHFMSLALPIIRLMHAKPFIFTIKMRG